MCEISIVAVVCTCLWGFAHHQIWSVFALAAICGLVSGLPEPD